MTCAWRPREWAIAAAATAGYPLVRSSFRHATAEGNRRPNVAEQSAVLSRRSRRGLASAR